MKQGYVRTGLAIVKPLKFTKLCTIDYQGVNDKKPKQWEMVQRTTRSLPDKEFATSPAPLPIDAVEICGVLKKQDDVFLVLVAQYRPPMDCIVFEFPAGLIDSGESPEKATIRELREETGYTIEPTDIINVSPPICPEPGISDTCCVMVRVTIDGNRSENIFPKQMLDEGEDIEVVLLPMNKPTDCLSLLNGLIHAKKEQGFRAIADAKVFTFLSGLSI